VGSSTIAGRIVTAVSPLAATNRPAGSVPMSATGQRCISRARVATRFASLQSESSEYQTGGKSAGRFRGATIALLDIPSVHRTVEVALLLSGSLRGFHSLRSLNPRLLHGSLRSPSSGGTAARLPAGPPVPLRSVEVSPCGRYLATLERFRLRARRGPW